ncbi:MAG: lytic transglycosylase domain-containing protein [Oligoflexia bacterium]|nr:lytic transglycosylase domain-containing protein [Oligoflexia bacterium]
MASFTFLGSVRDTCAADFRKCFKDAGERYGINPLLLVAIAKQESNFNPQAVNKKNRNGTKDLGIMQVNSSWLRVLKEYGIDEKNLFDPCTNINAAAWIFANAIKDHGSSWRAVGVYNVGSANGERREKNRAQYAKSVYQHYVALKLHLSSQQKSATAN